MNSLGTILTWNVERRTTLLDEQATWVLEHDPDVVCLQEVTPRALLGWSARLKNAGYHVAASALIPHTGRRLGVLIASRLPFTCAEPLTAAPWPERLLVADVPLRAWPQTVRVICLHAPTRRNSEEAKILTFEAVSASLAALDEHVPAILCGDLNAPQTEESDGTITTFGQTLKGTIRGGSGAREDKAERTILRGPSGWHDAYRELHRDEPFMPSWEAKTGQGRGYRLDHILLSRHLKAVECSYDHSVRPRLSDHSAMYATIELASTNTVAA